MNDPLPARREGFFEGPASGGAASKDPAQPLNAKILVVDDEAGIREFVSYELGPRGYQVVTAANGEEAIDKAKGKDIDIVVSDLTMPKKGGLDTLSALKAIDPKIEVIIVTGYATLENAIECMKRGAYDFITKPFQIDDLTRLIERALEKRRLSRKVDELQEINRFKSEFLANMSHELRTPMNTILGYTSLHLDRVYGEVNPKQEETLKRVETAGRNLLQLINSILDLSKVSAGRMPVYLEDFSLKDLGKEIVAMMDCLAKAKNLQFEWNVAEDIRLRSDKTKVKQILINLAMNGIKFTRSGGVYIDAKRASEASKIHIRVRDTGIGIKAEDLPLLFQEFKQLDSSSTREYSGTGLGLAISKKFAELLGGAIQVESAVGKGTSFTVVLPLESAKPDEFATTLLDTPGLAKHKKTLLAIDDDPDILKLLLDNLHGTDYGFVGAQTGEEGIAIAKKVKPFAITLDVMMPHQDGWSVLQALKNDPELRSIPVIMLSILDNKSLGFALGVDDYIVKPFERSEFLTKLKAADNGTLTGVQPKAQTAAAPASATPPQASPPPPASAGGKPAGIVPAASAPPAGGPPPAHAASAHPAPAAEMPAPEARADAPRRKVLVVDDEASVVSFLEETLKIHGYVVESVTSGKDALARLAHSQPPDLIFTDINMPGGVSGLDLVAAVEKDPRLKRTRVIILSASRLTPQQSEYLQQHVKKIIQKGSLSLQQILDIVKEQLETVEAPKDA